jgi:hypothetical protein
MQTYKSSSISALGRRGSRASRKAVRYAEYCTRRKSE